MSDSKLPGPASGPHARTGVYAKPAAGIKLRDKKVERLARKVRTVATWLEPSDFPMLRGWCELEILAESVYAAVRALGVLNQNGEARRLVNDYRLLRQTQAGIAAALGLTPAARQALKAGSRGAPFDLAAAFAAEDVIERAIEVGERAKGGKDGEG